MHEQHLPKQLSLFLLILFLAQPFAQAQNATGITFSHHDWELVCDNTRTCRAAGYQKEGDELGVSVLLTRIAGPGESVAGQLKLGNYDQDDLYNQLPTTFQLTLLINGRSLGEVLVNDRFIGELSDYQVSALLRALVKDSTIEFLHSNHAWRLSDRGATAVMLKMDEFQARLGTTGAIVRRGNKNESTVLPSLSPPIVAAQKITSTTYSEKVLPPNESKRLLAAFRAAVNEDDCYRLFEPEMGEPQVTLNSLTDTKLLASTLCWRGAYNEGYGYWIINAQPPYSPVLMTHSGSDYRQGEISASHKGRGLGDCWSNDTWSWNGRTFVHSHSSTTGMCKLITAGGTWFLPTLISDIRHQ